MFTGVLMVLSWPLFLASTTIQSEICQFPASTPVITAPTAGTTLTSRDTVLSGTTTAGSSVGVTLNGLPFATITSDENGNFQVQMKLGVGQNQIGVQASNSCGSSSLITEGVMVVLPSPSSPTPSPSNPAAGIAPNQAANGGAPIPLSLYIANPAKRATRRATIFVHGKTSLPATEIIMDNNVIVAELNSPSTTFGVSIPLQLGDNTIQIIAKAGNQSASAVLHVTRLSGLPAKQGTLMSWRELIWIMVAIVLIIFVGFYLHKAWQRWRRQ